MPVQPASAIAQLAASAAFDVIVRIPVSLVVLAWGAAAPPGAGTVILGAGGTPRQCRLYRPGCPGSQP